MLSDQDGYGGVPGLWSSHVEQNRHDKSTGEFGYGGVSGCCVDPVWGYQILSSYFYVAQVSRQTYINTMQYRPFEEWIKKRHQRDANPCGAYAHPTDERFLVRGGGGYNQGFFVYLAKACGGWVFAGVNEVGWVDVKYTHVKRTLHEEANS